jgi:hypothetical protein
MGTYHLLVMQLFSYSRQLCCHHVDQIRAYFGNNQTAKAVLWGEGLLENVAALHLKLLYVGGLTSLCPLREL